MSIKDRAFPPRTRYNERSMTEEMNHFQLFQFQLEQLQLKRLKYWAESNQSKANSRIRHASRLEPRLCWSDSSTKMDHNVNRLEAFSESSDRATRLLKTKQGLAGFANGSKIAAMADTGSRKNVMSESYAKRLDLAIGGSPSTFEIGNSKRIESIGR